jgi:universal stress protein A
MPGRILLPIDIAKCPLEVFSFVNKFADEHRVAVTLLYVVNLRVVVLENRVLDDLSHAAQQHLKRLSEKFLNPNVSLRLRVRVGKAAQEILAEARESNVDLIILSSYGGCPVWKRPFQPRIVEKVLRAAHCNATLLRVRTQFNCEEDWGAINDIISALQYTGLLESPNFPRPASA